MHSHLVASTVWRHLHGKGGEPLLRKVAAQNLVLVSTGAGDWLQSGGELRRVEGGYRFTAKKGFASGSPMGDLLVTSGCYEDPQHGWQVLHFPLAITAAGVTRGDDWDTHGMRGTGSHTVHIEDAFVAEESVSVTRARGAWNPAFDVICTLALPILMSTYVGVAERACELALERAKAKADDSDVQYSAGQLVNELFAVRALWKAQVRNAENFQFTPSAERSSLGVQGKTTLAEACVRTVDKAMELAGGAAYFRRGRIEALMRDVRAAPYHPMPAARQWLFSGRVALGLPHTP
jgi:acyl-CoA dehydrogenase